MKYKEDRTQEQRILALLQSKGSDGVYVYELMTPRPNGLGIAQYNARIKGLRVKGYNIINTVPGHFLLLDTPASFKEPLESQPERAVIGTNEINPAIEAKKEEFPYLFK